MSALGVSQKDRMISRVGFYLMVTFLLWVTNFLIPDYAELEARKWESLGVARPYIAVPVTELEMMIVRESR